MTKEQRSYNMSMIKGKNTRPEIILRKLLFNAGLRGYRLHYKLPGRPDVVFPGKRVAVFIDGCFWHRCSKCFVKPATNRKFWREKINSNVARDKQVNTRLNNEGWKVIRIWEHEVRNEKIVKRKIIDRIKDGAKKS